MLLYLPDCSQLDCRAESTNVIGKSEAQSGHFADEGPIVPRLTAVTANQLKLIELAKAYSPSGLSYAEEQMLLAAAVNNNAVCISESTLNMALALNFGDRNHFLLALTNSATWPGDCVIRADMIRWLCVDPIASSLVTYGGICISGARIDGQLNLEGAKVPFRVRTMGCVFSEDIVMNECQIKALDLFGTKVKNFYAGRLHIEESLNLKNGFSADGEVNLQNATVGGDLGFQGGTFVNTNGNRYAICADGIRVDGSVMLREGFHSIGEVRFPDSTIGGIVDCGQGTFSNETGTGFALSFPRAKVERAFSLKDSTIVGGVELQNTVIDGPLWCGGTQFQHHLPGSLSIFGNNSVIQGEVDLNCNYENGQEMMFDGVKIGGSVEAVHGIWLTFSTVEGNLYIGDVSNSTINVTNRPVIKDCCVISSVIGKSVAIVGDRITGSIEFQGSTTATLIIANNIWEDHARLDMSSSKIGTLMDQVNNWPKPGGLLLNNFVYDEFDTKSASDADSRIRWLQLQPNIGFLSQPYEQLAGVLRKMGLEEDAMKILIAKNREHSKFTKFFHSDWWWYNVFGKYLVSYGYEVARPFWISVFFIIMGTCFGYKLRRCGKLVHTGDKAPSGHRKTGREFQPFIYSIETFVPLFNLDLAEHWRPVGGWRWYFWGHRTVGWILTTLWVGSFTGLVKT